MKGYSVYFLLYILQVSYLKFRTIVVTEGATIIGTPIGQGQKIAPPFTRRTNYLGPLEGHGSALL